MNLRPAVPTFPAELPNAGVGLAEVRMVFYKMLEVRRPDLLFAFDDELDRNWQLTADMAIRLHRRDAGGDVPLVVGNATAPDSAIANLGTPWIAGPKIEWLGGLDVVMVVEAQPLLGSSIELTIDDREAASGVIRLR